MKKLLLSLAAAAALLMPLNAQAAEKTGFYIAPKFALSVQHSETSGHSILLSKNLSAEDANDTNAGFAIAAGYDFAPRFNIPVRAELEYGVYGDACSNNPVHYEIHSIDNKVDMKALLFNVYWDIAEWNGFKPYIGAGIGAAFIDTQCSIHYYENTTFSKKKTVLAGQLGLGVSYAFNDMFAADLGYRFLMTGNGKSCLYGDINMDSKKNYAHQFMLGLRVTF